jgi:hypothetical protein
MNKPDYNLPPKHSVFVLKVGYERWVVMESWVGDGKFVHKVVAAFDTEEEANGILKLLKE